MALLDDSGTYFDLGPVKVTEVGSFDYMCTRNNRFSTHSQKGRIISRDISFIEKSIGWNGGNISLPRWYVPTESATNTLLCMNIVIIVAFMIYCNLGREYYHDTVNQGMFHLINWCLNMIEGWTIYRSSLPLFGGAVVMVISHLDVKQCNDVCYVPWNPAVI